MAWSGKFKLGHCRLFAERCRGQFPGQVPQPPPVAHIGCEQVKVGKACGLPTAASKSSSEYFGTKISSSVWPRWSIVSLMAFIPRVNGTTGVHYTRNANRQIEASR